MSLNENILTANAAASINERDTVVFMIQFASMPKRTPNEIRATSKT